MTGVDISIPRCFESLRGSRGVRRKGEIRETRTMDDLYLRERPGNINIGNFYAENFPNLFRDLAEVPAI